MNPLIGNLTGFGPLDAVLKQYEDILAGFEPVSFAETQPMMSLMTILIFICATFFVQITMLNMLIAIMGDTFERITEQRSLFATRTKLALLADYSANIRTSPSNDDLARKFLFVVEPEAEEEGFDETWQGSVQKLHSLNKRHSNYLHNQNGKKFDLLDEKINEVDTNMINIKTEMNSMNGLVTTNVKNEISSLKGDITSAMESKVGKLDERMSGLEKGMGGLEKDMAEIKKALMMISDKM